MKNIIIAAAVVSAFAAAPAMAEPARYVQGNLGAVIGGGFDFKIGNGDARDQVKQDNDRGVFASVAVGQALTPKWTLEGEVVYAHADMEMKRNGMKGGITTLDMRPTKSDATTYGALLNANYEVYHAGKNAAYVGAGAGFGSVDFGVKSYDGKQTSDDTGLMFQIKAGVTRELTAQTAVDVSYRYLRAPEFGAVDKAPDFHNVTVGLRYNF